MASEKGVRKEKNQNIQVFVRLRPLNQRERDIKSLGVIDVVNNREVVVRQSQNSSHTKKFTFDRAFGPNAKQVEVYQDVVSPLIEEVLAGYNCTVFAYGQTGTGKTHTMVGESVGSETSWQTDPVAGIIPRALSQLFDELRLSNTEYTVRVSYLELYNEELFDLLSTSEDNSKLRIYEDVTRKGSNIVNGLEEITVSNKNEVYKIMAQGQERKRVASTLMNAQSRNLPNMQRNIDFRSHTVFTIVVHMRENSPEGEELVKIGKLNLVDLAGSENISKAGSDNPAKRERARECVNINQSLLTLGRVITALVERHPHIPYRESKLTRILQESLGGRTKTSIIATISPGHKDLEETLSTLEYAHRAKNIQNKPEVNQKMTKKAILKEYVEEIDRLKRDLQASRDKNGVYLATDTYTEITLKQEEQRKEIQELLLQKRAVEEQKVKIEALFSEVNQTLEERDSELNETRSRLEWVGTKLLNTVNVLQSTKQECEEQKHLVAKVSETERALNAHAQHLLATADTAARHAATLHDTVDKRRSVESRNLTMTRAYREQAARIRGEIAADAKNFTDAFAEGLNALHTAMGDNTTSNKMTLQGAKDKIEDILRQMQETMTELRALTEESHSRLVSATDSQCSEIRTSMEKNNAAIQAAVQKLLHRAAAALQTVHGQDVTGKLTKFVQNWYAGASERVVSLCACARRLEARTEALAQTCARAAAAHRDAAAAAKQHEDALMHDYQQITEKNNIASEKRLSEEMEAIEEERVESVRVLQQWMDEEVRRLKAMVDAQTAALDKRLAKKKEAIKQEQLHLQSQMASSLEFQQHILESNAQKMQLTLQHIQQWEAEAQDTARTVSGYVNQFDEVSAAFSADLELFSSNVVEVVEHLYRELHTTLQSAHRETERESTCLVVDVHACGDALAGAAVAALADAVVSGRRAADDVIHTLQSKVETSTCALTEVSSCMEAVIASADTECSAHSSSVEQMASQFTQLGDNIAVGLGHLNDAEAKYLDNEYKVYSPTGSTPARVQYQFPRALPATSPHERILARFRAMRHNVNTQHDECIEVDSDSESRSEGGEDTAEESAIFVTPFAPKPEPPTPTPASAPPTPTPPVPAPEGAVRRSTQPDLRNGQHENTIVKCISETDLHDMKRQQDVGKENLIRCSSRRLPSKLPAPTPAPASHKKPFLERNHNDN